MNFNKKHAVKSSAFTLSELLISLAVVGILVAIVFPIVVSIMPDQNTIMAKRAFAVTQAAVSDVLNDTDCYPERGNRVGISDGFGYKKCLMWQPPTGNNNERDAGSKFVTLFTDRFDLKQNVTITDGATDVSFQTKDGMSWTIKGLGNLRGDNKNEKTKNLTLTVDVNGGKDPNCGQSNESNQCPDTVTKGFDTFTMEIHKEGQIKIKDCWAIKAVKVDKKLHEDTDDLTDCDGD